MGSIVYQVKDTLQQIFVPGTSRDVLKKRGLAGRRITGSTTMEDYVDVGVKFAEYCEETYDIERRIGNIKPEMAEEYIQGMRDRELSGGYIGKVKAAIRKLDVAMKERGWRDRDAPDLLEPGGGWHSDRRPERAYTPQQAKNIIADMRERANDPQTADVAELQRIAGLRISEAVMLRGEDIDIDACTVRAVRGTKGGRPRTVDVDNVYADVLTRLKRKAEEHRDGHVFRGRGHRGQSLAKRTRGSVRHACERLGIACYGTHGFRKTWAQEQYRQLRMQELDDREARCELAEGLGHGRPQVTYSYVARR
jgi:integrase